MDTIKDITPEGSLVPIYLQEPIHEGKHNPYGLPWFTILGNWCSLRPIHSINYDTACIRSKQLHTTSRCNDPLREEDCPPRILRQDRSRRYQPYLIFRLETTNWESERAPFLLPKNN